MSFYIETGNSKGKADTILRKMLGSFEMSDPPDKFSDIPAQKGLVIVVDFQDSELAIFVYDGDEFKRISTVYASHPRRYILLNWADAVRLSGYWRVVAAEKRRKAAEGISAEELRP